MNGLQQLSKHFRKCSVCMAVAKADCEDAESFLNKTSKVVKMDSSWYNHPIYKILRGIHIIVNTD